MTLSTHKSADYNADRSDPNQRTVTQRRGGTDQLDPGLSYAVTAHTSSQDIELGTIYVFEGESTIEEYFVLLSGLPAGTTSIYIKATTETEPPGSYTFMIESSTFTGCTAPSSSSTLFVDSTNHIGLVWNFTQSGGNWSGSAVWYHNTSDNIQIANGNTVTLNNNTYDSNLTYTATNTAP